LQDAETHANKEKQERKEGIAFIDEARYELCPEVSSTESVP